MQSSQNRGDSPGRKPKIEVFEGLQVDTGYFFFSEKKNVSTKVRVNRLEQRIDIRDGIASKIPSKIFRLGELQQLVYHNSEC